MTNRRRPRASERGSILLLALLVLTLMMVFVADATQVSLVEYESSLNGANELKIEAALRYGFETARAHLKQDGLDTEIDSLAEEWNTPQEINVSPPADRRDAGGREVATQAYGGQNADGAPDGVKVVVEVEDEERKWPLGILMVSNEAAQRRRREGLVGVIDSFREKTAYDVDLGTAERMADLILAFMARREGENAGPVPRPPTKSPIRVFNVADLALIPEINDALMYDQVDDKGEVLPGLLRYLTVHSDLQINLNTAPLATLRGLFRSDDRIIADNIYDYRLRQDEELARDGSSLGANLSGAERDTPEGGSRDGGAEGEGGPGEIFQKIDDVKTKVVGFPDRVFREVQTMLTVNSGTFSIWVTATLGRVTRTRHYVVRRNQNGLTLVLSEKIDRDFRPRYRIPENEDAEGVARRKLNSERDRERREGRR
jgi:type II secretory pathway component PulK